MFKRIFWGIILILFAILLTLQALGITLTLFNAVPVWKLFLLVMFLYWSIEQIVKGHFALAIFPLVFLVMVFEDELVALFQVPGGDIAPWWGFILVGCLLTTGISLLTKNFHFIKITKKNKDGDSSNEKGFKQSGAISSSVIYIDCGANPNQPFDESIENDISSYSVYFVNTDKYVGGGNLNIDNNLGSVVLPKPESIENKKSLCLTGDNNLGKITVEYVETEEK